MAVGRISKMVFGGGNNSYKGSFEIDQSMMCLKAADALDKKLIRNFPDRGVYTGTESLNSRYGRPKIMFEIKVVRPASFQSTFSQFQIFVNTAWV